MRTTILFLFIPLAACGDNAMTTPSDGASAADRATVPGGDAAPMPGADATMTSDNDGAPSVDSAVDSALGFAVDFAIAADLAPPGGTGQACARNSDCPSGICLPLANGKNACSTPCSSTAQCVAGWECKALIGQTSNICQCTPASEICDGKDNDCNGTVDDEPGVDQLCAQAQGARHVCLAGMCVCPLQCGAACVDPTSDGANCGGCGMTCPSGATCAASHCACPSGKAVCGTVCVDVTTDTYNCGACGTHCTGIGVQCTAGKCICPGTLQLCGGTACVDFTSDLGNCGSCGHTCTFGAGQTATCASGVCRVVTVVASGLNQPLTLAVDATNVYWTDGAASVWKAPINGGNGGAGGGTPVKLGQTLGGASNFSGGLAVDATNVYWTTRDAGIVAKAPIAVGAQTTIYSSSSSAPWALAVAGGLVYWADEAGTIRRAATDGTGLTSLATGQALPTALAIDETYAYWVNRTDGKVQRVLLGGGTPQLIATGAPNQFARDVSLDLSAPPVSRLVFWGDIIGGTLYSAPATGGTAKVLSTINSPVQTAVDSVNVYMTTTAGSVFEIPRSGGAPVMLYTASKGNFAEGIVVAGPSVYWIETSGFIYKTDK